jgi:hypothetical protein
MLYIINEKYILYNMCWVKSFQYVYYQKNMINKVIYLLSIFLSRGFALRTAAPAHGHYLLPQTEIIKKPVLKNGHKTEYLNWNRFIFFC